MTGRERMGRSVGKVGRKPCMPCILGSPVWSPSTYIDMLRGNRGINGRVLHFKSSGRSQG